MTADPGGQRNKQAVGRLYAARDIALSTDAIPEAGPRDVVIRVAACGICGTDLSFYRRGSVPSGAILGHEFSGRITAAGVDVAGVVPGQRVVVNPMDNSLGLGHAAGAFAHYVRIANVEVGRNLFFLPDSISDEQGALIEPFAVGIHAVNQGAAVPGDRAVIYGAGTIGLCVLAALSARGVTDILVVDLSERRLALARRMGASAVHNPATAATTATAFVGSHYGEERLSYMPDPIALASIVFDCAGVAAALHDAVHSLATGGRLVLVADPYDHSLPDLRLVMMRELSVRGAVGYKDEFNEAIDLIDRKMVDLGPLITHRFPLEQISDAFRMQLDTEQAIKVLVTTGG